MDTWLTPLLQWLSLPQFGLTTVLVVSFVSATLLPLGSEPAVFGLVSLRPDWFWPAVGVATLGNTLGGMVSWWMGRGAQRAAQHWQGTGSHHRAALWLAKLGPRACFFSWLPVVGDPLCAVAGWLRLPFWPCVLYMAVGKCLRYVLMTAALMWVF